jgi:hypothetical protein
MPTHKCRNRIPTTPCGVFEEEERQRADSSKVYDITPKYLCIDFCPEHKFYAISIEDCDGGKRITPSKCCGRWRTIKRWVIDERMEANLREELAFAWEGRRLS